jgi:hypothetical protein
MGVCGGEISGFPGKPKKKTCLIDKPENIISHAVVRNCSLSLLQTDQGTFA